MNHRMHGVRQAGIGLRSGLLGGLVVLSLSGLLAASEIELKDGRVLRGRKGETTGLSEANGAGNGDAIKQIVFVNDDLRFVYVPYRQIKTVRPDSVMQSEEKFNLKQPGGSIGHTGRMKVAAVGPPAGPLAEFDADGRRIFPMKTAGGDLKVVQVITDLTPQHAKVEALLQTWDMRIATSTLSDAVLDAMLRKQINPKNLEHRKKIVRFYLQCKRYGMAAKALQEIMRDFSEATDIVQQLQPTADKLRQMQAQQILDELALRRDSGQHALVQKLLKKFPTEGVDGVILQTVREALQQYEALDARRAKTLADCRGLFQKINERETREPMARLMTEIGAELQVEDLALMAAFVQNVDGPLSPGEKLSLAASGWLLGADAATPDMATTLSAFHFRTLAQKYLTEPQRVKRERMAQSLFSEIAAKPEILAAMLAHMKPPFDLPELADEKIPGYYKLEVAAIPSEPPVHYDVQLPPEYNPRRRYPVIVSLHGLSANPEMQVEWWSGGAGLNGRQGQAARFGYIVIAPEWAIENQKEYEYSQREHAVVLGCMRDACRRFAVDTDRIFLSGHSEGGDAAWDIGVSHPDLWAGVIPISAEAKKFCTFYTENARNLPFYVVLGELDGGRMARNSLVLDRYLRGGFNTTVVEYLGRGSDHFLDEQLQLFDWMGRFKRNFFPREFTCSTLRPSDNFFWWAEIEGLPPGAQVNAGKWPPARGTQALSIRGTSPGNNNLTLLAGNSHATIWLSPELIDFNSRVNINVGGRRLAGLPPTIRPSVETMLEDVRTRGDRQHPFWAKVSSQ